MGLPEYDQFSPKDLEVRCLQSGAIFCQFDLLDAPSMKRFKKYVAHLSTVGVYKNRPWMFQVMDHPRGYMKRQRDKSYRDEVRDHEYKVSTRIGEMFPYDKMSYGVKTPMLFMKSVQQVLELLTKLNRHAFEKVFLNKMLQVQDYDTWLEEMSLVGTYWEKRKTWIQIHPVALVSICVRKCAVPCLC